MSRPGRTPATHRIEGLPTIFANAAALDIGADEIVVAVPPDRDPEPVRVFRTFTPDLQALLAWLLEKWHRHRSDGINRCILDSAR
jgi:transposase